MKKATIQRIKKGWLIVFEDGKKMPCNWTHLPLEIDGQQILVWASKGPIDKIKWNDKEFLKPTQQTNFSRKGNIKEHSLHENDNTMTNYQSPNPAKAPYNFVPLNKCIISSNNKIDHSIFNNLSGKIELRATVIQPLFIRGKEGNFFLINNIPAIAGSTLRGLIGNILSMVSYTKFEQFENKILYKRSNIIQDGSNIKQGFMTLKNNQFIIIETSKIHDGFTSKPYHYDYQRTHCSFSVGEFQKRCRKWKFKLPAEGNKYIVPKSVIESYLDDENRDEAAIDLIKSLKKGKIVNKKGENIGNVNIPQNVGIPVFFRVLNNSVISFGHARYHRIPYRLSIRDHVSRFQTSSNENKKDFSETIYGTTNNAGKIFFDDLFAEEEYKFELNHPETPKILSSPKPTTYQHYLVQSEGIRTNQSQQSTWNDENASIRGFKNYWHKTTSSKKNEKITWIETEDKSSSHPDPINPISSGTIFSGGCIRFENLTKEELGALLFALQLPEECCHKIGMGKPLGLGSVRLNVEKLTIIDRKERYEKIFDDKGQWQTGEKDETAQIEYYQDEFCKYMMQNLPDDEKMDAQNNPVTDFWKINRMQQLRQMLIYNHTSSKTGFNWLERTRYQNLNEFKKRPVLPTPDEVADDGTYNDC